MDRMITCVVCVKLTVFVVYGSKIMEMLMRVSAPHYVAGIIFDGPRAIAAAPILYWVVKTGRSMEWCINYFNQKGFKWEML